VKSLLLGSLAFVKKAWAKIAHTLSLKAQFGPKTTSILSALPFVLALAGYIIAADIRHRENPMDKIVPTIPQLIEGFKQVLLEETEELRTPTIYVFSWKIYSWETYKKPLLEQRLVIDLAATMRRFSISMALVLTGILVGLILRLPLFEAVFLRFFIVFEKIPPLALLAILFVIFGTDEMSKISLIFIGVFPKVVLDTQLNAKAVAQEMITKGFTLGASSPQILFRIILPQIMPKAWNTIRLSLGTAVGYLIAGEMTSAAVGLGYRMFVVRRYMAMNIIIDYIIILALIMFLLDRLMQWLNKRHYAWYYAQEN
jgi:NitT/TauT family transport system permease protein